MIKKKTWTEFDREYAEFTQWPLELSYRVYSDIVDEINKLREGDENEVADDVSTSAGSATE
jgi:hypothetical protein